MICILMIATILVFEIPTDVNAEIIEEWVARYSDPGDGTNYGYRIAVGPSGHIVVTGHSYDNESDYDIATIAYDASGNELWVARYNGPGNGPDYPSDICIDSSGNIYISGMTKGNRTDFDFTVLSYDSSGNELWVARSNGQDNDRDAAITISVGQSGHVYASGYMHNGATIYDIVTSKYDTQGNMLWTAIYNSSGSSRQETSYDICLDSSENVYVTGKSYTTSPSPHGSCYFVTLAYDSSGNELWTARYRGSAKAIAVDPSGTVYVTGLSSGIGTGTDFTTIAYDSTGNELWIARYNGPGNKLDEVWDMVTDGLGNVYVTGRSWGDGTWYDYATVAYDSHGNQLWVARYNGPVNGSDISRAMAIDSLGNIYVTGASYSGYPYNGGTYDDYVTVAYDSQGNELWVRRYNGIANSTDYAIDLALDSLGNVYVIGASVGSRPAFDFVTVKYSVPGPVLQAAVDIDPDTLNLKSKGRWITAYITLPEGHDVNDIDIGTILLEDTIPAEWGDIQDEKLMVKFDRSQVEDMLSPGTYNLKVNGELVDRTEFEGYSDEITVIEPP